MILRPTECRILAAIELDADRSAAEVARIARTTKPVVYRTIERLKERGVIAGTTTVIDLSRLGLIEFGFNLALAPRDASARQTLIERLKRCANVSWIAEVGGELDLMCNIVATGPHEAQKIGERILEGYSDCVLRRQICCRSRRTRYPRWLLGLQRKVEPRFLSGEYHESLALDAIDQKILHALSRMRFESFRDLAQQLEIPLSTFLRRLHALRERKIVLGFGYRIDLNLIEALQFRALLSFRAVSGDVRRKIHDIAAKERVIKLVVECLGSWDFELEIDQPKGDDVKRLTSLIHHELHGELTGISLIPIFKHLQYISFPAV